MRTLSPEKDESRGVNAAGRVNQQMLRGEAGASSGGGDESRRRRERFDGPRKIQWFR